MDSKAISTAHCWATKYIFTYLVVATRTEVSSFLREIINTVPPLLPLIGGSALPPIITCNNGWSGLNLPRSASVGGSYHLLFDRIIDHLML